MKIIYHSADLDGIGSAAVVLLWVRKYSPSSWSEKPERIDLEEDLIGLYNPLDTFDLSRIKKDETVYLVDISARTQLKELLKITKNVVWIDHHASNEEEELMIAQEFDGLKLPGIRECKAPFRSAIELAWNYLLPNKIMPVLVYHISRWDTWQHQNPHTVPVYAGLELYVKSLRYDGIYELSNRFDDGDKVHEFFDTMLKEGIIITNYKKKFLFPLYEKYSFDVCDWHGYEKVLFVNAPQFSSDMIPVNKAKEYDLLVGFTVESSHQLKLSVRTLKDDISVVDFCRTFEGGGGNRKAGGFRFYGTIEELISNGLK